jgi:3-hydroxyacyl-CoA dehydrogenase
MANENASPAVTTELHGQVLVVTVNNPPVNALGVAVRQGLFAAIEQAEADADAKAVLLVSEGKTFIAGADIREFGKPPVPPSLPEVCNRIEACTKPVVAALHGAALGGGLEVALGAHYRLALPAVKLGLPEVDLGLMPGAGGTQRAPRLMGVKAATEFMLSGKPMWCASGTAGRAGDLIVDAANGSSDGASDAPAPLLDAGLLCQRTAGANGCARAPHARHRHPRPRSRAGRADRTGCRHRQEVPRAVFAPQDHRMRACRRALPFDEGMALERRCSWPASTARSAPA